MKLITNGKTYNNVTGIINTKQCTVYLDSQHDIELGEEIIFTSDEGVMGCTLKKADYKVWKCTGNAVHINVDEEVEPTPYEPTIEEVRAEAIKSLNDTTEQTIYAGVDVKTSYGDEHFSLTANDQANIGNIFNAVVMGVEEFPYHADGKECVIYPKADIVSLYVAMEQKITALTTKCNLLKKWVNESKDKETIRSIILNTQLPSKYQEQYESILSSASAQIDAVLIKLNG